MGLPSTILGPLPDEATTKEEAPKAADTRSEGSKMADVVLQPLEKGAKYVANQFAKGFWNRINTAKESMEAQLHGELFPVNLMRLVFPGEVVDDMGHMGEVRRQKYLAEQERRAKEHQAKYGSTRSFETQPMTRENIAERFTDPDMKAPGPVSRYMGAAAEVVGDPVNLAGPGSAMRNLGTAAFAGLGSEAGGDVGGGVGKFLGGEEGGKAGTAVGNVVGGVLGAAAQDIRMRAAGEVVGRPIKAAAEALRAKRAGDERGLTAIFQDEFSNLRAETKGFIKQRVQEQIADVLDRDPGAKQALDDYYKAAKTAGYDPQRASIGERSQTPLFVETQRDYIPVTKEEAIQQAARAQKAERDMTRLYRKATNRTTDPKADDIVKSLGDLQQVTDAKLTGLANEGVGLREALTNLDPAQAADAGAKLRALHEAERQRFKTQVTDPAYAAFGQSAETLGTKDLEAALQPILGKALSEVDPSTVSPNLRNVIDMVKPGQGPGGGKVYKKLSTEDLLGIQQALNMESRTLAGRTGEDTRVAMANLEEAKSQIDAAMRKRLSADTMAKLDEANAIYRERYSPAFNQDINLNIRRKAGGAHAGSERVLDESILPAYLEPAKGTTGPSESRLRQFDAAFGGKLTGNRVDEAYQLLGQQVETNYARQVLQKKNLSPEDHLKFMKDYEAALNRVPETRAKLEETGTRLETLQAEYDMVKSNYDFIASHPITKAIGVDEARQTMAKALANPDKMAGLVADMRLAKGESGVKSLVRYVTELGSPMTDGQYDPSKLRALLDAGKATPDRPGGLQKLFEAALGPKEAKAHYDRLQSIASLIERQESVVPTHMRPMRGTEGPVKDATGSTAASLISDTKAMAQGRNSAAYMGSVIGSRYLNAKLGKSWREAEQAALYDPKDSQAVLDLMKNPRGPWYKGTAERLASRMGDSGKEFMDKLIAKDLIVPIGAQGAVIGFREAGEEQKRKAKEQDEYQRRTGR